MVLIFHDFSILRREKLRVDPFTGETGTFTWPEKPSTQTASQAPTKL
jgi:hypothetical protein